jgi:hypothetical protein
VYEVGVESSRQIWKPEVTPGISRHRRIPHGFEVNLHPVRFSRGVAGHHICLPGSDHEIDT